MSIQVDIHKNIGAFSLKLKLDSSARRIGILGASGSGKSMTLRGIAGIEALDSGFIRVNDRVLYDSNRGINLKAQQRNVGYMFQNYALFPTMTVEQNIGIALKCSRKERAERVAEMIRKLKLQGLEKRIPSELSGGQQQRVALARIMIYRPELILLDEPYSALDVYLRDRMQHEMLDMLEEYDGQVIMVSHSRDELYRFSQELYVINNGEVITGGETRAVFADPLRVEAARLTGCRNLSALEPVDSHTVRAVEWGAFLTLKRELPADTRVAGCRAHCFEPVWGEPEENCIRVELDRIDELPFEKSYYMRPVNGTGAPVSWTVQGEQARLVEERGVPEYLKLNEEHIMLLR